MAMNLGRKIMKQIPMRNFVGEAGTGGNPRLSSGLAGAPRSRPQIGPNRRLRTHVASSPPPPPLHVTAIKMIHLFIPTKTMCVVSFFCYWGIDRMTGGGYEEAVKMMMKDFGEFMQKKIEETGVSKARFMAFGDAKTTEAKESLVSGSAAPAATAALED